MQSKREEIWNSVSHGLGVLLGMAGLFILLFNDSEKTPYSTMSIVVYSISVILLYLSSTIYHAVTHVRWKRLFRKLDHISIYFLIAGTYTPVALITLEKGSGWFIFIIVWAIALGGTVLKIFYTGRFEKLSLFLYLAMGWLIIFDLNGLMAQTTSHGLQLLMLGGLFYTVGVVFYVIQKIPYNHVIWHFFVLGGSVSHFFFILTDVI
ncbi:PAQR family membrane homeostasis protein TrhA [Ascidiimonas aurantiaca]|uniref:PAQR family membrane homeostasis protein TrhA n=1 Tax=Ascidiimonas aurantiaca TaxID=1685432 RepID=UPI0030ED0094